ncbi:MAG: S8 family serine peptidase, partial [bacterium]
MSVTFTASGKERNEDRIHLTVTTPEGAVERLFRVNVETSPAETPYVIPAPIDDVDLFDSVVEEGADHTYKVAQDELLVTFGEDLGDEADRLAVIDALDCQVISKIVGSTATYQLYHPAGGDLWKTIDAFAALPFVTIAEPNVMRYIDIVPNDPTYSQQYCHPLQHAVEGWDVGQGDANQIIAIMDTGTGRQHPDLATKCVDGEDFVSPIGDGLGGDVLGDGVDNNGFNGVDEGTGHGVHCSGISAAISNNGVGGAGMAWNTKLMGLRIFPTNGDDGASDASIISAINYITSYNNNVSNTAKVVSCNQSFGGGGSSQTEINALDAAMASGCTFAAAAGNENTSSMSYPGAYANLIGVAAIDNNDVRASFSNYGPWVDVSAAGVNIWNSYLEGAPGDPNPWTYAFLSGTSMATPQVTGLIALVKGNAPSLSAAEVRDQIMNTTDNIDAENPTFIGKLGTGRINVFRALTQAFTVELEADGAISLDDSDVKFARGNRDGRINPGEHITILPTIKNTGLRGAVNLDVQIDDATDPYISFATDHLVIASITRSGMTTSEKFPVIVARNAPDNYEKSFTYTVTDTVSGAGPWNFGFTIHVDKDDPSADTVPGTAGDLPGGTILRPVDDQPFFYVDLTGDANYLTLKKLKVSLVGTVDPAAVTNIRLWADDGDGTFEGNNGDTELGLKSYLNASYANNFDRQSDPAAQLGAPQDRDIYPGASFTSGSVEFSEIRLPVADGDAVRLFVSADVSLQAIANTTIGLAILNDS